MFSTDGMVFLSHSESSLIKDCVNVVLPSVVGRAFVRVVV